MKIVVNSVIGMVKLYPFQTDLFDFSYIEEQVKNIKNSMEQSNEVINDQSIKDMLDKQLAILQDIQQVLGEINKNTQKKSWFKRDN